ncbi:MAG: (d)CMP kinase [Pseudorhodoplanes sp.]|jgi:cytidylate kinase|nr:(d)CMP kinase [Pseudorhodoplanes sp.]
MIIAIDGPAASGKGTLAKRLAAHYGYKHLDSGLLYRGVAKAVLEAGKPADDKAAAIAAAKVFDPLRYDESVLKGDEVAKAASLVAAIPEVRAELVAFQRSFAQSKPGALIDGRDIGTVIAPSADVKIFVTASAEERARRRVLELQGRGESPDLEAVLADIHARDARDMGRATAPLKQAPDAYLLDTTHLGIDAAVRAAIDIVEAARAGRRPA